MELGLGKCTTAVFKDGKLTKSQNISLNNQTVTRNMELDETYKYLGIKEGDSTDNSQMKNKLVKEYYLPFWQILETELNSKHNITAQHLSCTSHSLQLWNYQLAKKRNWRDRSKNKKACNY